MAGIVQPPAARTVTFNCPACGAKGVAGEVMMQKETLDLVISRTTTWVKCSQCNKWLYSKKPTIELLGKTPEQLEGIIINRQSLIAVAAAVLAIGFFWLPYGGVILAVLAVGLNFRSTNWTRKVSWIALPLAVVMSILISILIASGK